MNVHATMNTGGTLNIIAFRLHDQEFCVRTTTIREIRGWGPVTPIPHTPTEVIGVMNLRGTVIPIIGQRRLNLNRMSDGSGGRFYVARGSMISRQTAIASVRSVR